MVHTGIATVHFATQETFTLALLLYTNFSGNVHTGIATAHLHLRKRSHWYCYCTLTSQETFTLVLLLYTYFSGNVTHWYCYCTLTSQETLHIGTATGHFSGNDTRWHCYWTLYFPGDVNFYTSKLLLHIHIQMLHLNSAAVNFTVYEMLQILIQEGPCTELTVTLPQAFDL